MKNYVEDILRIYHVQYEMDGNAMKKKKLYQTERGESNIFRGLVFFFFSLYFLGESFGSFYLFCQ